MDDSGQNLIVYLIFLQMQKYLNAACLALWVNFFPATLRLEVLHIWNAPWNIPKILYLCTRYLPLVVLVLLNYYNQFDCVAYQKLLAWGVNVSICISEVIFALRTWAVWDRSRKMGWFLSLFFLGIWISTFIIIGLWTGRPVSPNTPHDPNLVPCGFYYSNEEQRFYRFLNFIFIVVFYGVTLCLTCIRGYGYFTGTVDVALMRVVHFDGILYYVCLFAVSVKILIMNFVARNNIIAYAGLLSGLQFTLCTLMACKMLLHLRSAGKRNVRMGSQSYTQGFTVHMDTLVFRHTDMDPDSQEDDPKDEEELPTEASRVSG